MKPIKLHWASSKPNFGDCLSPKIVEAVSGRAVKYAKIKDCDLVAVGSLLQRLNYRFWSRKVHIWGAGFIESGATVNCRHHVHAVRGPLSRARLGLSDRDVVYGDPGLLSDRLIDGKVIKKKHRLVIIAHYKDKSSPYFSELCQANPSARIVDIFSGVDEVLNEIAASHFVISSAMHGLIAADSLGVPNAHVSLGSDVRGGGFKFADYYGSLALEDRCVPIREMTDLLLEECSASFSIEGINRLKEGLISVFPDL